MNSLSKHTEYLVMQDGAPSHTARLTFQMMEDQKHLKLLQPDNWPPNSPDLNSVDYCVGGILENKVYRGRQIANDE